MRHLLYGMILLLLFGCGEYDVEHFNEPERIEITAQSDFLAIGSSVQFSAIGHYQDNTTQDLTAKVYWSNENKEQVSVSENGLVHGISKGMATIKVSWNKRVYASQDVEVKMLDRLVFEVPYKRMYKNESHQAVLNVVTDGLHVERLNNPFIATWSSSDEHIVSVDAGGLMHAHQSGEAYVSARIGNIERRMHIVVDDAVLDHLEIVHENSVLAKGFHGQYRLFAYYSDGKSKEVTFEAAWESSDGEIASIESGGYITALHEGNVTMTAYYGTQESASSLLVDNTSLEALEMIGDENLVSIGQSEYYYVRGFFKDGRTQILRSDIVWSSSDENILTHDGAGNIEGVAKGKSKLIASVGALQVSKEIEVVDIPLERIDIEPSNSYLAIGLSAPYHAVAVWSDGRSSFVTGLWDITNDTIATIDVNGLVYAHQEGVTTMEFFYNGAIYKEGMTVTP